MSGNFCISLAKFYAIPDQEMLIQGLFFGKESVGKNWKMHNYKSWTAMFKYMLDAAYQAYNTRYLNGRDCVPELSASLTTCCIHLFKQSGGDLSYLSGSNKKICAALVPGTVNLHYGLHLI